MEPRPYDQAAALIDRLKVARETIRDARNEQQAIEHELANIEFNMKGGGLPSPFPHVSGRKFIMDILLLMESDEEYRYETSSPRYDGINFIATTANINEYQSRFFGPLRHDEMRRLFIDFVRHLEEQGIDFSHYRTTMRYNYEQGDDADTGFRIELPVAYLKGGGAIE